MCRGYAAHRSARAPTARLSNAGRERRPPRGTSATNWLRGSREIPNQAARHRGRLGNSTSAMAGIGRRVLAFSRLGHRRVATPWAVLKARGWTLAAYSPRSFTAGGTESVRNIFHPHQDRAVVILLMFRARGSDSYYVAKNSRSLNSYRPAFTRLRGALSLPHF